MKVFIEEFKLSLLIVGVMCGVIEANKPEHREKSKIQRYCVGFSVIILVYYCTQLVTWYLKTYHGIELNDGAIGGLGSVIGLFGNILMTTIINVIKNTNWAEILISILSKGRKNENH